MPRGNGTGPNGMGPMTGRAAGFCAGYSVPGYANNAFGAGAGRGGGMGRAGGGRGWRNQFHATGLTGWQRAGMAPMAEVAAPTMTKEQELEMLKRQAESLSASLENLQNRMAEISDDSNS